MATQEERRQATRRRIVMAARDLLADDGIEAATTEALLGPVWSSDQEFGRSPARGGSFLIGRQSWREA
ncbi:hypothetical protein, partial [Streptomyces sp. NPDC059168]|uniref:hypothetical protein n=1 Tax=Streptomyces sp. NPDC059168 TaxID=3346753 RepID=UPI0036826FAB